MQYQQRNILSETEKATAVIDFLELHFPWLTGPLDQELHVGGADTIETLDLAWRAVKLKALVPDKRRTTQAPVLSDRSHTIEYQCPKCQSIDLEISVEVCAALIQTAEGFETGTTTPDASSHEWTEDSSMHCRSCNHRATAYYFEIANQEETR